MNIPARLPWISCIIIRHRKKGDYQRIACEAELAMRPPLHSYHGHAPQNRLPQKRDASGIPEFIFIFHVFTFNFHTSHLPTFHQFLREQIACVCPFRACTVANRMRMEFPNPFTSFMLSLSTFTRVSHRSSHFPSVPGGLIANFASHAIN